MPDLHAIGEALFGPQWQAPLARALRVNLRTVQRWAAGEGSPNETTLAELRGMLIARRTEIARLLKQLG